MSKVAGAELLWQNPAILLRRCAPGDSYDDARAGGWDELLPNDEPATIDGVALPVHGELWTSDWECEPHTAEEAVSIRLRTRAPAAGVTVEKNMVLRADEECLRVRFRLTNERDRTLRFL